VTAHDPNAWQIGTDGGRLTNYTAAGAEIHSVKRTPVKPAGMACTHCGAEGRPISTRDELLAFRAQHVACRPVWAKDKKP